MVDPINQGGAIQVKKFLCLFLTFLLLAASCAVAEEESVMQSIMLEAEKVQLESCLNAAGDKYIIKGTGEPQGKIRIVIRNYSDPEQTTHKREGNRNSANINSEGKWEIELPILDDNGKDVFGSLGDISSVYLWAQYIIGEDTSDFWYIGELVRMSDEKLNDVVTKKNTSEQGQNEFVVFDPVTDWGVRTISFRILTQDGEESYAKKDVTLRVKGNNSTRLSGKTDEDGNVTFVLTEKMWRVGTQLELVNNSNQKVIAEYIIPAESTPIVLEIVATPGPDASQPTVAPAQSIDRVVVVDPDEEVDGILLKGLPMPLVIVLCAVFLIGYGVCWFLIKNPQKSRGKGV